ncbi:hypothetical protein TorRG33x02_255920, partial [Trema orientale]
HLCLSLLSIFPQTLTLKPTKFSGPRLRYRNITLLDEKPVKGILGHLIDHSKHFYKPLQGDDHGSNISSYISVLTFLFLLSISFFDKIEKDQQNHKFFLLIQFISRQIYILFFISR